MNQHCQPCRSGVALAMRHRLSGLSTYGFDREMSTPPTLRRGTAHFTFTRLPWKTLYQKRTSVWRVRDYGFKLSINSLQCRVSVFRASRRDLPVVVCRNRDNRETAPGISNHTAEAGATNRRAQTGSVRRGTRRQNCTSSISQSKSLINSCQTATEHIGLHMNCTNKNNDKMQ